MDRIVKFVSTLVLLCLLSACEKSDPGESSSLLQVASGEPVVKGTPIQFPKDHGPHHKQGIEWWYLTANLESESGERFGVQWTLFRTLVPNQINSKWWDNNLYFAHFALQHQQQHVAFERFARAGQASVQALPFKASIDNWSLASTHQSFLPLELSASHDQYSVQLSMDGSPVVFHGEDGYSQKTESGHASFYYSYPFLQVSGYLTFDNKRYKVTGNSWLDREWSASLLDNNQRGWDWFCLVDENPDNGALMLFCIRGDKQSYDYCSGTRINTNGQSSAIQKEDIKLTVTDAVILDNKRFPSQWQIDIEGMRPITIDTITKDSRNKLAIPYWEGRIQASGGFKGLGYAELTGY